MHVDTNVARRGVVKQQWRRNARAGCLQFVEQLVELAAGQLVEFVVEFVVVVEFIVEFVVHQFVIECEQHVELVVWWLFQLVVQLVVDRKFEQLVDEQLVQWRVVELLVAFVVEQFQLFVGPLGGSRSDAARGNACARCHAMGIGATGRAAEVSDHAGVGLRVVVFGATGMAGAAALREALEAAEVESVLAVGRHPCGVVHPKVVELLLPDR